MLSFGVLGVLTLLKYPYPRDIAEPSTYEKVRVHAEWGKNRKSSIEHQTDDAVQSVSERSESTVNPRNCFTVQTAHFWSSKYSQLCLKQPPLVWKKVVA